MLRSNLWATGFLVVAVVNLLIYLHTKCKYEGNLFMVSSLKELFDFCNWIVKKLEPDRPEILHALEKTQKIIPPDAALTRPENTEQYPGW